MNPPTENPKTGIVAGGVDRKSKRIYNQLGKKIRTEVLPVRRILVLLVVVLLILSVGCSSEFSGLFGLTKPDADPSAPETQVEEQENKQDRLSEIQADLEQWYKDYDTVTSVIAEEYPFVRCITPEYLDKLPEGLAKLVEKHVLQRENKESSAGAQ